MHREGKMEIHTNVLLVVSLWTEDRPRETCRGIRERVAMKPEERRAMRGSRDRGLVLVIRIQEIR